MFGRSMPLCASKLRTAPLSTVTPPEMNPALPMRMPRLVARIVPLSMTAANGTVENVDAYLCGDRAAVDDAAGERGVVFDHDAAACCEDCAVAGDLDAPGNRAAAADQNAAARRQDRAAVDDRAVDCRGRNADAGRCRDRAAIDDVADEG